MSFLTPLFLLGGLALALPVVFHLVRRTTRTRTRFSSLMFLEPTPPRLTRRSRIEHWLLLVLRCLALALLAFAFARPFIRDGAEELPLASAPKDIVVLVDTSASMRREGLWPSARARVEEITRNASPIDRVAVLAFSRRVTPLVSFGEWTSAPPDTRAALARERLAAAAPDWAGTHLGEALVAAADALTDLEHEKSAATTREVVLVSDVQAGSRLDMLQAYEWPKGVSLRVETLAARRPGNAGLQWMAPAGEGSDSAERATRLRVTNAADSNSERFTITWIRGADGAAVGSPLEAYVPPGQTRTLSIPAPDDTAGVDRIELRGDSDAFDNTVFVAPLERRQSRALYVGNETADDPKQPLYFLTRALPSSPSLAVEVVSRRSGAEISAADLQGAAIVFASDPPSPEVQRQLRAQAMAGKTVVLAPKSAAAAAGFAPLFDVPLVAAEEAKMPRYAMWGEIDFKHPLFAAFADPRFGDFTKIHVWKHRALDAAAFPDARVIARFDSGDPALIEAPLGKGRALIFATGWNPEDSQLAVSSKFVPLMWSILELAGEARQATPQFVVGDAIPLEAAAGLTRMRLPGGRDTPLAPGDLRFHGTSQPGIYLAAGAAAERRFVVNMDASETRTEPLSLDELERLGVAMKSLSPAAAAAATRKEAPLRAMETESRQKLWRWFIGATLLILIVESIIAGWTARRAAPAA